ncbi:hypothetical protein ABT160_03500 [Streptomyces sp. NPDC001941]|uniref:hypothetical protein n=1 Tax=Streptomyces sp. NPDC001941 TaxID=3154659 RepID=UPI003328DD63
MGQGKGGGSTSFEGMSHEEMLQWLDEASPAYVRVASEKLASAAGEIRKIAQMLQFRPERVEWKGEAFTEFTNWGNSLANATYRLADYSDGASTWLGHASEAITQAQSAAPRYTSHADAKENLAAANKAHNDPDAAVVSQKAQAVLQAKEDHLREAAAAEMRKLSQTYAQASSEMGKMEVPTFQPPPTHFVPTNVDGVDSYSIERDRPAGYVGANGESGASYQTSGNSRGSEGLSHINGPTGPGGVAHPQKPVDLGIDSVGTLPPPITTPPVTTPTPQPPVSRPDMPLLPPVALPSTAAVRPPASPGPVSPTSGGKALPSLTGRGAVGPLGPTSALPREQGITGGRAMPPTTAGGRPVTGLPRGTVIGQEGGTSSGIRGPMGGGMGAGMPHAGGGVGQGGGAGRRLAYEQGGIVGGRPQQGAGDATARPFTPGGTGLVRGGTRDEENRGQRPDYLVEDEETWQPGTRRIAPPVID